MKKRFSLIISIILISGILNYSVDLIDDKFFSFIGWTSVLSVMVLYVLWLWKTRFHLVTLGASFLTFTALFLSGFYLYQNSSFGISFQDLNFGIFVFWSFYELILLTFFSIFIRSILKLIKK